VKTVCTESRTLAGGLSISLEVLLTLYLLSESIPVSLILKWLQNL